jgi:hypothetical protein
LLRYLVAHDIRVPIRPHCGPNRGQLVWRRPTRMTLQNMLHHPIYAGAYRWGHRKVDPRKQQPGRQSTGRIINVPEVCDVLIPHRFPAYISWERLAAIQQRLADNRAIAEALGTPREGPSLLAGLLVCRRCGRRLMAAYGDKANHLRYTCMRATIDYGTPGCLSLAGAFLERFVATPIMQVLQPASLELSVAAEHALRAERERLEVILCLAHDVPGLWRAVETTPQDRQEIVRLLVDRITVDVRDDSEQVEVTIHWAGGVTSAHRLRRPVARYDQLSNVTAL